MRVTPFSQTTSRPPAVNVPLKMTFLAFSADVDESAHTDDAAVKEADIDAPAGVHLRERKEGRAAEPAAVVKVELVGLVDDRRVIDRRPGISGRGAADQPLFVGEDDPIEDPFFGGDVGDAGGDTRPQVADGVGGQLQGRAAAGMEPSIEIWT